MYILFISDVTSYLHFKTMTVVLVTRVSSLVPTLPTTSRPGVHRVTRPPWTELSSGRPKVGEVLEWTRLLIGGWVVGDCSVR